MRGKRSKQYRKLMQQYGLTFGFREPYQILVDAQMIQDTDRFKMDLITSLERTLHGKVKPMITQCSIRHLYTSPLPSSQKEALINTAKAMERRRCGHHTLEAPLSALECISNVLDSKGQGTNKNRYVVASQEEEVRRHCRGMRGVPLLYVKRSVMVMEPMAERSVSVREGIEREKFRAGLRGRGLRGGGKRKREEEDSAAEVEKADHGAEGGAEGDRAIKRMKTKGMKGPNPLSVKKSQKVKTGPRDDDDEQLDSDMKIRKIAGSEELDSMVLDIVEAPLGEAQDSLVKRKRKRKHKSSKEEALRMANQISIEATE